MFWMMICASDVSMALKTDTILFSSVSRALEFGGHLGSEASRF